ncbi:MAG: exo-alpha-sialidase [Clostridia bacterium]|nr:exo-alpha-sialidase [Clostridia bacterium]
MLLGSYQSEFAVRIWKSTDSGDTWTKVYNDTEGTYQHVHRMYVDTYQNPVAIYAGMDRGSGSRLYDEETSSYYHVSGGVLKSVDGGSTWTNLYADQKGKPQAVDHGVTYADDGYRLLGGETGIVGGASIVRTTDDINFTVVLSTDHAVYGPEKLNGYLFAGGCGSNGGTSATLYISDDEGVTWKQIYSEEANADNTLASAGIKTFCKGVFAGTDYEQLIAHNNCSSAHRPSKRIFADADSWYSEIIVDVPEGTNSITVESGYMCPNLSVINNDAENVGDAVFVMDFNENGRYLKEKVSGNIYKGDHLFTSGGRHLGYIYPDVKSATDMNAIKIKSPMFDTGIKKKLNLNASEVGLTISFWLNSTVNGAFEIISDGSNILHFDGMHLRCDTRHIGSPLTTEGGRFVKIDIVFDIPNNLIKSYKNGICENEITDQTKIDLVASLLTGEKYYTLLKRSSDDDITAIQHFEIRHGVPTDKDVYNSYFSGLTDNY